MVTTWNLERKLCLEVLFILFLSEIFLSNGSLNCSLSSLWFLTDLIWHSVRPSLSKHCATRWFHLGKGGYVVRNRAHLTDLLQFIFLGTVIFWNNWFWPKMGHFCPNCFWGLKLPLHPPAPPKVWVELKTCSTICGTPVPAFLNHKYPELPPMGHISTFPLCRPSQRGWVLSLSWSKYFLKGGNLVLTLTIVRF